MAVGIPRNNNLEVGASYIQSWLDTKQKEKEIARRYGFSDKDQVTVHILPKGQKTKRFASFSYTPMTGKAKRLQASVYSLRGRITKAENADMPPKEKAKLLRSLRAQLKYASTSLNCEMANAPRVASIVLEEGEEGV
jgi:hypothetical protein